MPYVIRKVPGGFKVFTEGTHRAHSQAPLTKQQARQQQQALYVHAPHKQR